MAKRGRPRKVPLESTEATGDAVAVLDPAPTEAGIYEPDYEYRRYWMLGIKVDEERQQLPFHNAAFGGTGWHQGTQRQVRTEDGWLGLDHHRVRLCRELLSAEEVRLAVSSIRQKVVRWVKKLQETDKGTVERWAASVFSLENRIKTYDKKKEQFVPAGYRFTANKDDVPVSSYLVFIPRSMLEKAGTGNFYEPNIDTMDSMLDLDPSLVPDRMSGKHDPSDGGDEVW